MAEEVKRVISIDTTKSSKSIKQLREEVAGLTADLENLEIGSTDYTKKLEDLVEVQNKLSVATESMQGVTVNAIKAFDSVNQIAGGLAGGISAVSAAFTLFGRDTDNLQKAMVKLQAAIAIVQGIGGMKGLGEGILNGIKSFKALAVAMGGATTATGGLSIAMGVLRTAIVSTGIGALVVAVGMLIDYCIRAASGVDDLKISIAGLRDVTDEWGAHYQYINTRIAQLEVQRERDLAEGKKNEIEIWRNYADEVTELETQLFREFSTVTKQYNATFLKILQSNKYFRKEYEEMHKKGISTSWSQYARIMQDMIREKSNEKEFFLSKLTDDEKAEYEKANQIYNDYIEKRENISKKAADAQEKVKLMELAAERKDREEKKKEYIKKLEDRKKYNQDLLKAINDFYEENRKLLLDDEARELDELNEKYQAQLNQLQEALDLKLLTTKEYNERLRQINNAYIKDYLNDYNAAYKRELADRLSSLQEMQDRESQLFANKESALNAGMSGNYETRIRRFGSTDFYQSTADVNREYENTLAYNEQLYNLTKDRITRENELMFQQQMVLKEQYDNRLITEKEYFSQSQALKLQQEANDIALSEAANAREEEDLQAFKDRQAKKQQAIQATLNVASSLTGALANAFKQEASDDRKAEKQREKSFKVYKALATTQAIIDTVSSAQSAYKSIVGIPYIGPFLAPIAAAAAVVAGMANVKAIQNEQLPSSGGGNTSAGTVAPSALNTAPVEYTRNLLGNKEIDELNQPIKCYVVESDITNAQNKVAVTESNASF